jgi:hypothetical protein
LGYIKDFGDLTRVSDPATLPQGWYDFACRVAVGDKVLIFAHHHPFALATVDGDYNYIRTPVPMIGVPFRHFRRVRDVKYYGDCVTNPREWDRVVMTNAFSVLNDPNSQSYRIIEEWP